MGEDLLQVWHAGFLYQVMQTLVKQLTKKAQVKKESTHNAANPEANLKAHNDL